MKHTMAIKPRKDFVSDEDAEAIAWMKEAGGILIAKTNVPELNLWTESRNMLYGQSNNPYDTNRTVGGSSGGDAGLTAACGTPFTVSSDIGGSIRMPAYYNGCFGIKPSPGTLNLLVLNRFKNFIFIYLLVIILGMTSLKGIGLRKKSYPESMAEVGPICKRAEDLIPLLKVLVGPKVTQLKLDDQVRLDKLKIYYQESSGELRVSKINPEMRAAMRKVVDHFKGITGNATKVTCFVHCFLSDH